MNQLQASSEAHEIVASLLVSQWPHAEGSHGPCSLAVARLVVLMHLTVRTKFQLEILFVVKVLASQKHAGAESVRQLTLAWEMIQHAPTKEHHADGHEGCDPWQGQAMTGGSATFLRHTNPLFHRCDVLIGSTHIDPWCFNLVANQRTKCFELWINQKLCDPKTSLEIVDINVLENVNHSLHFPVLQVQNCCEINPQTQCDEKGSSIHEEKVQSQ